jgi:hypothetical protein
MERNRQLIFIVAALILNGCLHAVLNQPPGQTLYSWRARTGEYRYALIADKEEPQFLRGFNTSEYRGIDIERLKISLAALQNAKQVAWRDDRTHGLTYPDLNARMEIKNFAAKHHVDLQILPTAYD